MTIAKGGGPPDRIYAAKISLDEMVDVTKLTTAADMLAYVAAQALIDCAESLRVIANRDAL